MTTYEITVKFCPQEIHYTKVKQADGTYVDSDKVSGGRSEHWESSINGKHYSELWGKTEAEARAAAERAVARCVADDKVRPLLFGWYGQPSEVEYSELATTPDPEVELKYGDQVVVYSRGAARKVIVTKVGRKNIEVAYVTEGGVKEAIKYRGDFREAQITHKTVKLSEVLVP
jgi:hypothetical protein